MKKTVVVTEHGVRANRIDCAAANRRALNRLLRRAKDGTTLVFPEGDYYVAASKLGGISIAHKQGVTLRGENAALINTSYSPAPAASLLHYPKSSLLSVRSSKDVTIKGLTLDYAAHTSVSGVITEIRGGSAVFRAYDGGLRPLHLRHLRLPRADASKRRGADRARRAPPLLPERVRVRHRRRHRFRV